MNTNLGTTPLRDDTPEDWQRLFERAAIVRRTRAPESSGGDAPVCGSAPLLNPTPEDRKRLLERAAIVQRTRALEEALRSSAQTEGGAEIAPQTLTHA